MITKTSENTNIITWFMQTCFDIITQSSGKKHDGKYDSSKTRGPIRSLWNEIAKLQHKSSKEKRLYLLFHIVHCPNWQNHMSSAVKRHTDEPTETKVSKTLISQSLLNLRRYHLFSLSKNCPLWSPDPRGHGQRDGGQKPHIVLIIAYRQSDNTCTSIYLPEDTFSWITPLKQAQQKRDL